MDNLTDAFIREAHDITLDAADKADVRNTLIRVLRLGRGSAGTFAMQPVAVASDR